MQLVSGLKLGGYWVANMVSDIAKALIPCILFIVLTFIFGLNYEGVWILLLVFPFAVVPFSYVTSFLFDDDTMA